MSINKLLGKRRGMTGLETAIILVAFVITAAFAFVVLNMGFLKAKKAQSVISSSMSKASSAMLIVGSIISTFNQTGGNHADVDMVNLLFT